MVHAQRGFNHRNIPFRQWVSVAFALPLLSCTGFTAQERDAHQKQVQADIQEANQNRNADFLQRSKNSLDKKLEKLKNVPKEDIIDPRGGLNRDDYNKLFYPGPKKTDVKLDNFGQQLKMPSIDQLMTAPNKPLFSDDKLVTLSVTEDIPLKEVLVELARRADVDIEIDPGITGGIIFRAKDKPFSQVIERIARLSGLKYEVNAGVLRVERDMPTIKNYRMNLLNIVRTSSSTVNVNTNLLNSGSGGGSISSGSGSSSSSGGSSGGAESGGGGVSSGSVSTLNAVSNDGDVWASIQAGVNNILSQYSTLLQQQRVAQTATEQATATAAGPTSSILSLNRQAGIISVLASTRQHDAIRHYLDQVQIANSSQVLIEAKILEVSLDDEYRSGINWNFLNRNGADFSIGSNFSDVGLTGAAADQVFTLGILPQELFGIRNTSLDASIQLLEQFGTTRTLSSPRLHAMNNQYAVLTFAENYVYFELDLEQEDEEDNAGNPRTTLTVTSDIKTIPIGVLLALQPSIDLERNEVVMNVRPTLSRVTGTVEDPAVALVAAQNDVSISSDIPIVEIRELDSVLRLKSGEVMVIGGLMEERVENVDRGVPGVSRVPVVGNAFKSVVKDSNTVETVIFIKATIMAGQGGVTVEDQRFYDKFSSDHRGL